MPKTETAMLKTETAMPKTANYNKRDIESKNENKNAIRAIKIIR